MITLTLIVNMLLFVYQQLVLHFNFFPFNNMEGVPFETRIFDSVLSGAISLFTLLSIRLGHPLLIGVASGMLAILAGKTIYLTNRLFATVSFDLNHRILLALQITCFLFTLFVYLFSTHQI